MDKKTEGQSQQKFKKLTVIMDSMSDYELDHDDANKLFSKEKNRKERIARGAGASPEEVDELLMQYQKLSQVVKKMGGMKSLFKDGGMGALGGMGGAGGGMPNNRQMAQLQQDMSKMIDPRMLNQMGGMAGLQNMMKQFTQGGGFPGMPGGMNLPPGMFGE